MEMTSPHTIGTENRRHVSSWSSGPETGGGAQGWDLAAIPKAAPIGSRLWNLDSSLFVFLTGQTAGRWGVGLSIQGPTGAKGPPGLCIVDSVVFTALTQ